MKFGKKQISVNPLQLFPWIKNQKMMENRTLKIEVYNTDNDNQPVLLRFIHLGSFSQLKYQQVYVEIARNFVLNLLEDKKKFESEFDLVLKQIRAQKGQSISLLYDETLAANPPIKEKVEKLFLDWVILIEFKNAIVQAKSINEYFDVKPNSTTQKMTIKEKVESLIDASKTNYEALKLNEQRLRLSTEERGRRNQSQSLPKVLTRNAAEYY